MPSASSRTAVQMVNSKQKLQGLPRSFKIIAGSYEKLLYGLHGTISLSPSSPALHIHLTPLFAFSAHISSVKSISCSPSGGKWLASGSSDELIHLWDLRRLKHHGSIPHHSGSISQLLFPTSSHLFSASHDGSLAIFRARDWDLLRVLKGHKGAVNNVTVHPSNKAALSVGKDRTLRMWDLMRGKGVASTKLGKEGESVQWSTDGNIILIQSGSTIDIYTNNMTLVHTIAHPSRVHDVRFCRRVTIDSEGASFSQTHLTNSGSELLLVAAADKRITVYDVSTDPDNQKTTPRIVAFLVGHTNRVKAVQTIQVALPHRDGRATSPTTSTTIACSVSSDGTILIYDLSRVPSSTTFVESDGDANMSRIAVVEITPEASYDTKGSRLICIALADGDPGVAGGGRSSEDPEQERESSEEESESEIDEAEWGGISESTEENESSDFEWESSELSEEEKEEEGEVGDAMDLNA